MAPAPVPSSVANMAPDGTKFWMLNVGYLECDEAFVTRGGGLSTLSNPNPPRLRRSLVMYCILIEHPVAGLILWETGSGPNYPEVWGAPLNDIFARVKYDESHELPTAIAATGHDINDVKMVILGHLHLDHAGGLGYFADRQIPIWVHEQELRHAFWALSSKEDPGVYMPHYLKFETNWKTFNETTLDIVAGITLHHFAGHSPGLIGMQLNLPNDGTFLFTSDHFHVKENYVDGVTQGWLARDHTAWFQSTNRVKRLEMTTGCRVIPGHDENICAEMWDERAKSDRAYWC